MKYFKVIGQKEERQELGEGIFDACRVSASQNQNVGMGAVKFVQQNDHNVLPLKYTLRIVKMVNSMLNMYATEK